MNRLLAFIFVFGVVLGSTSCLITPPEPPPVLWMKALDFETNTPIRTMYASDSELQIIADDEYVRMAPDKSVRERRSIPVPFEFYSWPVLAEHSFCRITRTEAQGGPMIELHLAASPTEILRVPFENLKSDSSEIYAPVSRQGAHQTLAYNDDGSQLLIPVVNFENNSHTFFLIDIQLDFSKTLFTKVEKTHRVDILEIPASVTDRVTNIVFEDGFFYVVSMDGTFRISPDGSYQKVISDWMYDVFQRNDTLFASSRGGQLHFSTNRGLSFVERNEATEIQFADVVQGKIYSQRFTGAIYGRADSDQKKVLSLILNADFPDDDSDNAYAKLLYFYDAHYMVVQKEVYLSCGMQTQEE